jgi:hypothetical protein
MSGQECRQPTSEQIRRIAATDIGNAAFLSVALTIEISRSTILKYSAHGESGPGQAVLDVK